MHRFSLFVVFVAASSVFGSQNCSSQIQNLKSTARVYPSTQPIEGRVVDVSGWPIVGAVVVQHLNSDDWPANPVMPPINVCNAVRTDVRGKFKLTEIEHRFPFNFAVYHPDYLVRGVAPFETMGDIVLTKPTMISGRLTNHDGTPATDCLIRLGPAPDKDVIGFEYGNIRTNSEGIFTIPTGLKYGTNFYVSKPKEYQVQFQWHTTKPETQSGPSDTILVVGEDFEARLPKRHSIEITVVSAETGAPVPLESTATKHSHWAPNLGNDSVKFNLLPQKNSVVAKYLRVGSNRIWLQPTTESKHLDCFVDIEIKSDSPIKQNLELKAVPGVVVSGSVMDETTGQPIADAAVRYLTNESGSLLKQSITIPDFVRTDEKGQYSFVVPAVPAILQVIGDCKCYQTLPSRNLRNNQNASAIPAEVSNRLEREIAPNEAGALKVPAFQLSKSPVVSGVVVDQNDKPLADVAFVLDREHEIMGRSWVFGKTNSRGEFTIDNLFTNPMHVYSTWNTFRKHNTLFFWHKQNSIGKHLVLIEESLKRSEYSLTVQLKPTPAAWGRVVDKLSKEPIEGVKLTVKAVWGGGLFVTGATSRDDGTFLLEHLARTRATIWLEKPGTDGATADIQFEANDNRLVIELEDIALIKTWPFGKPDRPDSIEGLTKQETLANAIKYIETQFSKFPPPDKSEPLWSYAQPPFLFRQLVAKNLTEHGKVLFDESNSNEFQIQAAVAIMSRVGQGMIHQYPYMETARELLHKNIDHKDVAPIIRSFNHEPEPVRYAALKYSRDPETRQWAVPYLLSKFPFDIRTGLRVDSSRSSDEDFQKTLSRLNRVWGIALNEFPDVEILHINQGTFREYIQRTLVQIDRFLEAPNIDQDRAKLVRETLKQFRVND